MKIQCADCQAEFEGHLSQIAIQSGWLKLLRKTTWVDARGDKHLKGGTYWYCRNCWIGDVDAKNRELARPHEEIVAMAREFSARHPESKGRI